MTNDEVRTRLRNLGGVALSLAESINSASRELNTLADGIGTDAPNVPPPPPPAGLRDGLDITGAHILNSPTDIASWAITAKIERMDFRADGVHVEFDKSEAWPESAFMTAGEGLQYTLWIFLNLGGAWVGSGCIQYWKHLDANGGNPEKFASNWYYDSNRWDGMTGHQPAPGEMVAFMISQGDARNNGKFNVRERSATVYMPFPSSGDSRRTSKRPALLRHGFEQIEPGAYRPKRDAHV